MLQRPIAGFTASAGYALVDTEVVAFVSTSEQFQPGQPLLRRPKHSAMLRANYARGRATVNFNLRYVGQRHDAAFLGLSAVAVAAVSDRTIGRHHRQPGLHRVVARRGSPRQPRRRRRICASTT